MDLIFFEPGNDFSSEISKNKFLISTSTVSLVVSQQDKLYDLFDK